MSSTQRSSLGSSALPESLSVSPSITSVPWHGKLSTCDVLWEAPRAASHGPLSRLGAPQRLRESLLGSRARCLVSHSQRWSRAAWSVLRSTPLSCEQSAVRLRLQRGAYESRDC